MKKKFIILILVIVGGTKGIFAQSISGKKDRPFYIPKNEMTDSFHIQLDKGNSVQIRLTYLADMKMLINTDSIIKKFKNDMLMFGDSLLNPLSIKSVTHLTDASGRTYIRLHRRMPASSNYLINGGHKAALKIEQDTVRIIRIIPKEQNQNATLKFPFYKRYVIMIFYLNDLHQVFEYENTGLDSTISKVYEAARTQTRWTPKKNLKMKLTGNYSLAGYAVNKKATVRPLSSGNNYLTILPSANLQNVYQYLAPSASIGIAWGFPVKKNIARELILSWEPMFLFEKSKDGTLQTYRNDWIVAGYSIHSFKEKIGFSGDFSISYLIRRKGDFFDKHTFRLGLGGITLDRDRASIQPIIYFHGFLKGITPGVRLSVGL